MSEFLTVSGQGETVVKLPLENDGTLLVSVFSSGIPDGCGLKYKLDGVWHLVHRVGDCFSPPSGGWGDQIYFAVYRSGVMAIVEKLREGANKIADSLDIMEVTLSDLRDQLMQLDAEINRLHDSEIAKPQTSSSTDVPSETNQDHSTTTVVDTGSLASSQGSASDVPKDSSNGRDVSRESTERNDTAADDTCDADSEKANKRTMPDILSPVQQFVFEFCVSNASSDLSPEDLAEEAKLIWRGLDERVKAIYHRKAGCVSNKKARHYPTD